MINCLWKYKNDTKMTFFVVVLQYRPKLNIYRVTFLKKKGGDNKSIEKSAF